MAPIDSSTATPAVATRAPSPIASAIRSESGAVEVAAAGPSTRTVVAASPRYSTPTTATAIPVASGTSRRGDLYSAATGATASQPANAHTSKPAAATTPATPCGANGPIADGRACGAATATVTRIRSASTAENASCTLPDSRTPRAFMAPTPRMSARETPRTVTRPPPNATAT